MRHRVLFALILMGLPSSGFGADDDAKALSLAKDTLNRGAELFDKREAKAMAATFIETAEILLVKRESDTDRVVIEKRSGRAAIETAYADIFEKRLPEHKCRNTVDLAKFLSPDMLLIHGRFTFNIEQDNPIQFVQVRVREGDQWKVATMQLMEIPKEK